MSKTVEQIEANGLRKVFENLSKSRVEYLKYGSNSQILGEIFEIEKKVLIEIGRKEVIEN